MDKRSKDLLSQAELIYRHPEFEWYYVIEKQTNGYWKVILIDEGVYKGDGYVECPTVHCSTYDEGIKYLKSLARRRNYVKVNIKDIKE